ncbi:MAG: DmsE family decaheme c-type cytochrome [Betaproteobacteria bacterium]|nr:DmsE family decaheme c-type cytochrome [Betaproteobacteria bacterium]
MRIIKQLAIGLACSGVFGLGIAADAPAAKPVQQVAKAEGKAAKEDAKDIVLNKDAVCTTCHDETDAPDLLAIGKTRHGTRADARTPTCTSCHGESKAHVDYRGKDKPPKPDVVQGKRAPDPTAASNACLACHQGGKLTTWQSSTHGREDTTCSSCHNVHKQKDKVRQPVAMMETCFACHKEQRAQFNKVSRHPLLEGKMVCNDCHNVHGDNPRALKKASVNETCYTCHMEYRGPFVHNHQPVTEDCGICHQAHGTNAPMLLKQRPPFLCQECHSDSSAHVSQMATLPTGPAGPSANNLVLGSVARGCLNCHTNIHGGNSTVNSATAGRFRR